MFVEEEEVQAVQGVNVEVRMFLPLFLPSDVRFFRQAFILV